jgi:nitroreductase
MDPIDALHSRVSAPALEGPVPDEKDLQDIFLAALRAADHARLRPWRFLIVRGTARVELGKLYARATVSDDPEVDEQRLERVKAKPLRAPLIVVAIARVVYHPKVPEIEQLLSTGAAVQNMLNAAHMKGLGSIWRTGSMTGHPIVRAGLGLKENEQIVGFMYLGRVSGKVKSVPELAVKEFFTDWSRPADN